MQLTDTHCHIHQSDYPLAVDEVLKNAKETGVKRLICASVDEQSSKQAVAFAAQHECAWVSVGVHPHEAKHGVEGIKQFISKPKVIAIGECGLDYFYTHSTKQEQIKALERQLDIAVKNDLPVIFHVREAFEDFWPVLDNFQNIQGVLHSFTSSMSDMEEGLKRGLFFGVNGIITFTKDEMQREMFASMPLERILLETDAPYLTPKPNRGKKNQPAYTLFVAEYLAKSRQISLEQLSEITEKNVNKLFFNTNKQR